MGMKRNGLVLLCWLAGAIAPGGCMSGRVETAGELQGKDTMPANVRPSAEAGQEPATSSVGSPKKPDVRKFPHGFRHDPMKWVRESDSLDAALVRMQILGEPREGDADILAEKVEAILSEQKPNGQIGEHPLHTIMITADALVELSELGVARDHPSVVRALDYLVENKGFDSGLGEVPECVFEAMQAFGRDDIPGHEQKVRERIDTEEKWNHLQCGCPWTPAGQLIALWKARHLDRRADGVITRGLREISSRLNAAGCADFNSPWGYLDVAGTVDHPLGRRIVEQQGEMILRSQDPDGGWGQHSVKVFRALKRYGLLEPLCAAPPLRDDWVVARSIPAPEGDLCSMAFGNGKLWLLDGEAGALVAVSPEDGTVVQRLDLDAPHVKGIGWLNGMIAVTQHLPTKEGWSEREPTRHLLRVDPESGQIREDITLQGVCSIRGLAEVGDALVIADVFYNAVCMFDPQKPGRPRVRTLAAPGSTQLAADAGALWQTDWLLPRILFKSDPDGALLDWGTIPFDGPCDGIAHDGRKLWALDARNRRICVLERLSPVEP
jgi:hypothetical protein